MKELKPKPIEKQSRQDDISTESGRVKFQSVTRMFLTAQKSKTIYCPHCGNALNFDIPIEWMGPDAFLCGSCNHLLHMSLIHRALRDLGVE